MKKLKCTNTDGLSEVQLTVGSVYELLGINGDSDFVVKQNNGHIMSFRKERFEVLN